MSLKSMLKVANYYSVKYGFDKVAQRFEYKVYAPSFSFLDEDAGYIDNFGRRTDMEEDELEKFFELKKMVSKAENYWTNNLNDYVWIQQLDKSFNKKEFNKFIEEKASEILEAVKDRHMQRFRI